MKKIVPEKSKFSTSSKPQLSQARFFNRITTWILRKAEASGMHQHK
ncbi:MAG: hypothetical protein GXC73_19035 [Chitinophagaceae bacterium]|nr:hypothetical protein [Chitinophagaceae bacterium]